MATINIKSLTKPNTHKMVLAAGYITKRIVIPLISISGFLLLTATVEGSSFCFLSGILRHTSNLQPPVLHQFIYTPLLND